MLLIDDVTLPSGRQFTWNSWFQNRNSLLLLFAPLIFPWGGLSSFFRGGGGMRILQRNLFNNRYSAYCMDLTPKKTTKKLLLIVSTISCGILQYFVFVILSCGYGLKRENNTNIARSEENRFWNLWIVKHVSVFRKPSSGKVRRYLDIILTEK